MMSNIFETDDNSTPLTEEEKQGLIPDFLTLRSELNKIYSPIDICARFHQRLTYIHPFPNGNGRHARLMTDLLMEKLTKRKLNWGDESLIEKSETRDKYINALHKADTGDYKSLIEFIQQ